MALRIVNDSGVGFKTKIYDAETGEDLTNKLLISTLSIDLSHDSMVTARLTLWIQKTDIIVEEADIKQICPYCGAEKAGLPHEEE